MRQFLIELWGFILLAATPRLSMLRRRACDSLRRVPTKRTARLCWDRISVINRFVGWIFIRSVHQRKLRVGGM